MSAYMSCACVHVSACLSVDRQGGKGERERDGEGE